MIHQSKPITQQSKATQPSISGYLRLWQIIGCKKRGIEPLLPISRSAWYAGIASGKYPPGISLGDRTTAWRKSEILALLENLAEGGAK